MSFFYFPSGQNFVVLAAAQDDGVSTNECIQLAASHDGDGQDLVGHVDFGNGVRVIRVSPGGSQQQHQLLQSRPQQQLVYQQPRSAAGGVQQHQHREQRVHIVAAATSSSPSSTSVTASSAPADSVSSNNVGRRRVSRTASSAPEHHRHRQANTGQESRSCGQKGGEANGTSGVDATVTSGEHVLQVPLLQDDT